MSLIKKERVGHSEPQDSTWNFGMLLCLIWKDYYWGVLGISFGQLCFWKSHLVYILKCHVLLSSPNSNSLVKELKPFEERGLLVY